MEEFSQEFDKQVMSGDGLAESSPAPVENEPTEEKSHVVAEESTPEAPEQSEPEEVAVEEKPKNGYMKSINRLTRQKKEAQESIQAKNKLIEELQKQLEQTNAPKDSVELKKADFGGDDDAWIEYQIEKRVNDNLSKYGKTGIEKQIEQAKSQIETTQKELTRETAEYWNEQLNKRAIQKPEFQKNVQDSELNGFNWGAIQPSLQKLSNGIDVAEAIAGDPNLQSMVTNTDPSLLPQTLLTIGFMNQSKPQQQKQVETKKPIPSVTQPKPSTVGKSWADIDKELFGHKLRR